MFGSHFYDEICADQEHMRLVAHMCHTARTEKDVLNLSVTTLVNNDVFDKNLVQSASCDRIILTVTEEPHTKPKVEALRLFEDSEEYLVAEMGTIPYASQPTSVRVVRSRSQSLIHRTISATQLNECCAFPNMYQIQYSPRFRNRQYSIKDGIITLIPDNF